MFAPQLWLTAQVFNKGPERKTVQGRNIKHSPFVPKKLLQHIPDTGKHKQLFNICYAFYFNI